MDKPEQALDFAQDAVSSCGYSLGTDVQIALNCAASEFYDQVSHINESCDGHCFFKKWSSKYIFENFQAQHPRV